MSENFSGKSLSDLEDLIDKEGLKAVLKMVADVCWAKADHIAENWQDRSLSRRWETAGKKIDRLAKGRLFGVGL